MQGEVATLNNLAYIHTQHGNIEEAILLYQQLLELQQHTGNVQGEAATLGKLAYIHTQHGDIEEAILLYQQSLELQQ